MLLGRLILKVMVPVLLTTWGSAVLAEIPAAAPGSEETECFPRTQSVLHAPKAKPAPSSTKDCPLLSPARAQIVADWEGPAQQIQPLSRPEGDAPIPVGTKVKLTLFPSEKVSLIMEEEELKTVKYAGLLTFRTGKAGNYRILANPYMWFEVAPTDAPEQIVIAGKSDKRLKCYGIMRNITFELAADTRYWLQISGAPEEEIEVLIAAPESE